MTLVSTRDTVREAGELTLAAADQLGTIAERLSSEGEFGDAATSEANSWAATLIRETANEMRRHALSLIAEAEQSRHLGPRYV